MDVYEHLELSLFMLTRKMIPTISVIVPVYNTEKYLQCCIDSILSQTFTDFELLLINDGSTDSSGMICDEYAAKDNRINVFHKKNGGVSSARNVGLDNAKGEWVIFVDADDYLCEESLECLLNGSCADLVVGGYIRIHRSTGKAYSFPPDNKIVHIRVGNDLPENWVDAYLFTPWCKLFKRKKIEDKKLRFSQDLFYGEDTDFVIKYVIGIDVIQFISKPVYYYCYNEARTEKYVFKTKDLKKVVDCMFHNFDLLSQRTGMSFTKLRDTLLHDYCSLYLDGLLKIQNYKEFLSETKSYNYKNCVFRTNAIKNKMIIWLLKYCPRLFYSCIRLHKKLS